jgi:4-hydroxy-tetrahydrodipicolinate synthase
MSSLPNASVSFKGVISLLLTPFSASGEIRRDQYERYVEWQARRDVAGIFAVCGSSEMRHLSVAERLDLAGRAAALARPLPVIATANLEPDPSAHRDEIRRMEDRGVSGVVLVPPSGMGEEPERLFDYFAAHADAATVPVFLYEWPGARPNRIPAEWLPRLAERGVVGIKDTTCTAEGIAEKIAATPSVLVYQACTPLILEALERGAGGIIAVTSTVYADAVSRFWRAAAESLDSPETRDAFLRLVVLDSFLRMGYPAAAKYLLRRRGVEFELHCRSGSTLAPDVEKALSVAASLFETP